MRINKRLLPGVKREYLTIKFQYVGLGVVIIFFTLLIGALSWWGYVTIRNGSAFDKAQCARLAGKSGWYLHSVADPGGQTSTTVCTVLSPPKDYQL